MRIDGVGLALSSTGLAVGPLAFDDDQTGSGGGAVEPDAVAGSALDRHDHPRPGSVVEDPGQQLGETGAVVADLAGGDRDSGRERDLDLVGITVGVDSDDGVDEFCQHGHRPGSFQGERAKRSAPAWIGVTEWHICDGARAAADRPERRRDRRLQARPGVANPSRCTAPHTTGFIITLRRAASPALAACAGRDRCGPCWVATPSMCCIT